MKPIRIFIFFIAVFILLSIIAFLIPQTGILVSDDVRLTFFHLSDLARDDSLQGKENVEQLLASAMVTDDPETDPPVELFIPAESSAVEPAFPDGQHPGNDPMRSGDPSATGESFTSSKPSTSGNPAASGGVSASGDQRSTAVASKTPEMEPETALRMVVAPANADSLKRSIYRISFAQGEKHLLDPFFRELDEVKEGENLRTRIIHLGDSQIENDRMTALIRYRFQKHFGGTGTGLVQAIPLYSGSMSYQQDQEGEWLRYTFFGKRDTTIGHNSYGVMGAFASVPAAGEGELPILHYRFNTARRSGRCDNVRVFLHSYVDNASLVFQVNDTIYDTISNIPDGFSVAEFRQYGIVKDLKLHLDFPEGGRIYGISFESYRGLQMDNIAMRGSSGLVFSRMNREQLQAMMDQLAPGLILLQFGGNVVPYMNPGYYRRTFKQELQFFKEICPGVPVVVIGPADMSTREKGVFKTYPHLELIRDALKSATLESGFGFWDLYEAMGGKNSMPSFVNADPPLANNDYIHFNKLGINLVAEMFYNALMIEYDNYMAQYQSP